MVSCNSDDSLSPGPVWSLACIVLLKAQNSLYHVYYQVKWTCDNITFFYEGQFSSGTHTVTFLWWSIFPGNHYTSMWKIPRARLLGLTSLCNSHPLFPSVLAGSHFGGLISYWFHYRYYLLVKKDLCCFISHFRVFVDTHLSTWIFTLPQPHSLIFRMHLSFKI